MTPSDLATVLEKLRVRAKLNPPATTQQIADAEAILQIRFAPIHAHLFSFCDGFEEADSGGLVRLWSLQEIVDERARALVKDGKKYYAVGDVVIYSHIILSALQDERAPVYFEDDEDEVAGVFSGFLRILPEVILISKDDCCAPINMANHWVHQCSGEMLA